MPVLQDFKADFDRPWLLASLHTCTKNADSRSGPSFTINADWKAVFGVDNRLAAEINRVDRTIIVKKIGEAAHLLDVVEKKIGRNEFEGVSPGDVTELSEGAFQMASQLEMYSTVGYKVQTFGRGSNRRYTFADA